MSVQQRELTFLEGEYNKKVLPTLKDCFKIANPHMVPRIEKVVVSMRFGRESSDKKAIEAAQNELALITGRKPAYAKAKKSISGFKLREGQIVGAYCTLRGGSGYRMLQNLIYIALPRIRDFRGFSSKMLDKQMNFNFGISDHLIFPELSYDSIHKSRGLDVTIVIKNAKTKEMALCLLQGLNFPVKS